MPRSGKLPEKGSSRRGRLSRRIGGRARRALVNKDFDKAIATINDAIKSDAENLRIIVARGWAYEGDVAMADYNLALQKRPNLAAAYNDRGTMYLRKGALQSALDDFSSPIKYAPTGSWLTPAVRASRP